MAKHSADPRGRDAVDQEERADSAAPAGEATHADGAADGAREERLRRAEEMVDRVTERVGHYAGIIGHEILRFAARAREEAEDIWAEAQSLRRGERP
jgi:hypothetical protein